jgi:hypothetical protein
MGARYWNGTLKKAGNPAAPVESPDLRRIFHFRPDLACVLPIHYALGDRVRAHKRAEGIFQGRACHIDPEIYASLG